MRIAEYKMRVAEIWREIKSLDKAELLHLLSSYDEYVRQIQNETGCKAVSLAEFYIYDFQDYFKHWKSDLL